MTSARTCLRRSVGTAVVSLLAVLTGCRGRTAPPSEQARALAAQMAAGRFEGAGRAYALPYRVFVPRGYQASRAYPLVLYLHGASGSGDDGVAHLSSDVAALVSARVQALGPAFVLAPQCPRGDEWVNRHARPPFANYLQANVPESDASKMTFEVLERVRARYNVDPSRLYVTGPSMGGSGTWDFITRHPGVFAAAVPVTGVNDPSRAPVIAGLPIWAFHGSRDTISSAANTRAMVEALRRLGSPVKFTELEAVGHDSWTHAYANLELYRWLFAQRGRVDPRR
jgi:predicted peptidase